MGKLSDRLFEAADAKDASEHIIQTAFFAAIRTIEDPRIPFIFACPNGGDRNAIVAANMVAEGVKRGVPDVILPFWSGRYFMGAIEFKRPIYRTAEDGGLLPDQIRYRDFIVDKGGFWRLAYTWDEGFSHVLEYLGA